MYTVLLADDETIIRQGLYYIIDWNNLGFQIIGEASDGIAALSAIIEKNPDVVLLDIKMPKLSGLEVARLAREQHYTGKIIILSGFSDFKYAQESLLYDVKFYLTKPIDAKELESDMNKISLLLKEERLVEQSMNQYRSKLKKSILTDLIYGNANSSYANMKDLQLDADIYQVVIYEKFSHNLADISYNFSNLLRVTNQDNNTFDTITVNNFEVIILKGSFALKKLNTFVERLNDSQMIQKGSPLDSLFLTYGRPVTDINHLSISYLEALQLMERRFFCKPNQHTINYTELPDEQSMMNALTNENMEHYCNEFIIAVQTSNHTSIDNLLQALEDDLYHTQSKINDIKLFLADLFIRIKENITYRYYPIPISLPNNTQVIEFVQTRYSLYQVLQFYHDNMELIINTISTSSSDSIMNDIKSYIDHNYMQNLKLEGIAALFGYNSSYLGKTFSLKIGMNFNAYLDKVRVQKAKELLETSVYKVYLVSNKVGYKNVDAFHTKFKKATGLTPAEYKRLYQKS